MKATGIIREIDKVGRIVIPKELRAALQIGENDSMEIFTEGDSIVLKKYEPNCIFCRSAKNVINFEEKRICQSCLEKLKKF